MFSHGLAIWTAAVAPMRKEPSQLLMEWKKERRATHKICNNKVLRHSFSSCFFFLANKSYMQSILIQYGRTEKYWDKVNMESSESTHYTDSLLIRFYFAVR